MLPFRLDEITNERVFHESREYTYIKVTVKVGGTPSQEKIILLSSVVRLMRVGFTYNPTSWIETAHASRDGVARLRKMQEQLKKHFNDTEAVLDSELLVSDTKSEFYIDIIEDDSDTKGIW